MSDLEKQLFDNSNKIADQLLISINELINKQTIDENIQINLQNIFNFFNQRDDNFKTSSKNKKILRYIIDDILNENININIGNIKTNINQILIITKQKHSPEAIKNNDEGKKQPIVRPGGKNK